MMDMSPEKDPVVNPDVTSPTSPPLNQTPSPVQTKVYEQYSIFTPLHHNQTWTGQMLFWDNLPSSKNLGKPSPLVPPRRAEIRNFAQFFASSLRLGW